MKMATCLAFFILFGVCVSAQAAKHPDPIQYQIDTIFKYTSGTRTIELRKDLRVLSNSRSWRMIARDQSGFMVLGKLADTSNGRVQMNYKVIRNKNGWPLVLSSPSIIAKLGESTQIAMEDKNERMIIQTLPRIVKSK